LEAAKGEEIHAVDTTAFSKTINKRGMARRHEQGSGA
jgi:hypothetical protein